MQNTLRCVRYFKVCRNAWSIKPLRSYSSSYLLWTPAQIHCRTEEKWYSSESNKKKIATWGKIALQSGNSHVKVISPLYLVNLPLYNIIKLADIIKKKFELSCRILFSYITKISLQLLVCRVVKWFPILKCTNPSSKMTKPVLDIPYHLHFSPSGN